MSVTQRSSLPRALPQRRAETRLVTQAVVTLRSGSYRAPMGTQDLADPLVVGGVLP